MGEMLSADAVDGLFDLPSTAVRDRVRAFYFRYVVLSEKFTSKFETRSKMPFNTGMSTAENHKSRCPKQIERPAHPWWVVYKCL